MKKSLIFFLLISNLTNLHAQYQSIFGDSITEWGLVEPNGFFQITGLTFRSDTTKLIMGADTLHKVKKTSDQFPSTNEIIYVKEDLQNGKIWAYTEDLSFSELIVDLSLEVGDHFIFGIFLTDIVVDSVYYLNGRKHIRFDWDYHPYSGQFGSKFEMVEGVGNSTGLAHFSTQFSTKVLICQSKDHVVNYDLNYSYFNIEMSQFPFTLNCSYLSLGIAENSFNFNIYPNPATDRVYLKSENGFDLSGVRLSNSIGQAVDLQWISEDSFSVEALKKGLYFISVSINSIEKCIPLVVQ
ncbi:T9SS type A sorting domain-containing protein [Fluviicola sp.]|jgi:hypothetical protein|uniref:T9SS type A sorting domain-containing protein n=1 Tax=Fluviicola sp. TaxID=1917219 RepID=UPI00281FECDA|nr:T9SS type A sorting domain-containing protein [Fluviicola sp.]MDR0802647.1 T9SS type A sorting domain-containing protein [Fluviicola sp.]